MTLSLDLLRSFLAVHRAGSITAGAERLGLAQPTVTAQLRALEAALGRPLFERQARGVRATAAGDELARRIAEPVDALQGLVADELDEPAGTVHLGGPADYLCHQALPALSGRLADGLQLRVRFGLPDELLDGLANRTLDVVISSIRPRRTGLSVTPLYDELFALVAAPRWSAGGPVRTPEALRSVPLIAYAEEAPIVRRYWRSVFGVRLTRTPDLVVPDLRGVLSAVLAGAGASVLPTYLCADAIATGELVLLAQPELPPLNTGYVVTRSDAGPRSAAALVRDELLRRLS
ncbi:transcriptional regulator, LysR family [Kribbella flavida DSM 17836]|uniref:Transcriptional regulator, LysR family n=1 Tax=Kribbella flavida (strain DSM 17836 / JCM 10339 / NBRC 14399) TaxID=479435 RepID=D2Q007_KRIFD|nr:LysR family transcriptional regulator [Kribbella flavida]ADB30005.1 transcriptional regulator, LysR family [Kribbella flavida DSM 17836]